MALTVAIVGFGDEGRAAYRFYQKQAAKITIFDEAEEPKYPVPADAQLISGPDCFQQLHGFDKILRGSPAIRPDRIPHDGELTSVTKEFFALSPTKKIIGVTATKGKGTIVSIIQAILTEAGQRVHVAGNIGVPALDILDDVRPDDVVVLELSSFQLWDMTVSPHIAVVGMIEPEHLEIHKDMAEYVAAKGNIARFQMRDDVVIYHPTNTYAAAIAAESPATTKIRYNTTEGAYFDGDNLKIDDQVICTAAQVRIPGPHNLENICAAVTAAWQYTTDAEAAKRAIMSFTGLEHRLEFVREVGGVKFYNDSISTTPGSLIAAINSFDPAHELLIVGGAYNKGADFTAVVAHLAQAQPKKVYFVGPIGAEIAARAAQAGFANGDVIKDWSLSTVVHRAATEATGGDVVILSPAVASFGDFANYKARGLQFKDIVSAL